LSQSIDQALPLYRFGKLVDVRNGEVLAIVSSAADTARGVTETLRNGTPDWTAASSVAAGIGISLNATELSALPQAYQEAERAVEFALPDRPVMHFAELNLVELLTHRPDATALRLIPDWAARLKEADADKAGALSRTIHAFADCNFNVKRTARHLDLHANTVYFRLNRISKLTGVNPRSYSGISLLLTTLRLVDAEARRGASRR
jgi:sugar diacid utilization regulator